MKPPTPLAMDTLTLWLAGDVMTGRGIDQIQAHPVPPALHERCVHDARDYVRLAEQAHGPVPKPVAPPYIWGDALAAIRQRQPEVGLVNLETAITTSDEAWPGKGIHYRMHPANLACLSAAHISCCALANNHVLDWGRAGLTQTQLSLQQAGIASAGAGHRAEAFAPAILTLAGGTRVLVFSVATSDSGLLPGWSATARRTGVALLPELTGASAQQVATQVARHRQTGDRVVVSVHWGGNWAPEVCPDQRHFAHRLIELGAADVVHGHSSHHPRPLEVYRERLIVYGCGDLINDYEGIPAPAPFDNRAVCLYFVQLARDTGALQQLEIVPLQLRRLQLQHASPTTRQNLLDRLNSGGDPLNARVEVQADGRWHLRWA